jgi:hypothetical protein
MPAFQLPQPGLTGLSSRAPQQEPHRARVGRVWVRRTQQKWAEVRPVHPVRQLAAKDARATRTAATGHDFDATDAIGLSGVQEGTECRKCMLR